MDFEWDEEKSEWNRVNRGFGFEVVHEVDWGATLTVDSPRGTENRYITIGVHSGQYWAVVWTWRGDNRRRIISVRRMHEKEARKYGL